MLSSLSQLALRHPRRVAVAALVFLVVAGVLGGPTAGLLNARNSFQDPASQSARAEKLIQQATAHESTPGVLALVSAPPSSPAVASVARAIAAVPGVASVTSPATGHNPALESRDGTQSLVVATLRSAPDPDTVVKSIQSALAGRSDVKLGGGDVAGQQVGQQATMDLALAELIAFPLLAILAVLIFRGVAALLPIAVGATSVLGTFLVLRAVNTGLPLSSFALNLVIGLGLGLAIDYSLLMVWRFREELGRGADVPEALRTTVHTAGKTVLFSAVTVAAALATLTLFPQRFLVSMGIGGMVVALVAAAAALLVMPALLVLLAGRVGKVRPAPDGTGRWYRLAQAVMRRPVLVAATTTIALLVVASPALGTHWSGIDASVLPTSQSARVVSDALTRDFPSQDDNTITIAAGAPSAAGPELAAYADELRHVPGVASARQPTYLGNDVWQLTLGGSGDPISAASQRTVQAIRDTPEPAPVLVGGQAADYHDQKASIDSHVPLALAALVVVTLVILWLMTGSVILPIKTLLMNVLTVAAATGLLVYIFQDGRLTGPLAYTGQGGIEQTDFLVLVALVFALSTDYGVLLLGRIKEGRDRGLPDREAIAVGMERTGRLVTLAAILLAVAIGAFATSKVVFLKEVGVGTAIAVLIDAFIIRTLLVPSLMALLGARNWWSPAPLRRLHRRLGISETTLPPADAGRLDIPAAEALGRG